MLTTLVTVSLLGMPSKSFFKSPMFYNNSDCSGAPKEVDYNFSRLSTVDDKWMNALEFEYLQDWGLGSCLQVVSTTAQEQVEKKREVEPLAVSELVKTSSYASVKFVVNDGWCGSGGGVEMAMMYYSSNSACSGVGTTYNLTGGMCVETPYGYAKWESVLSDRDELCAVQRWVAQSLSGGMRIRMYGGANCTGTLLNSMTEGLFDEQCSEDSACDGCCPTYDSDENCMWERTPANVKRYEKSLQACRKVNGVDMVSIGTLPFQDSDCTIPDHTTFLNRTLIELGTCQAISTPAMNFTMTASLYGISAADHCAVLEIARRHNLGAGLLTYDELVSMLNGGSNVLPCLAAVLVAVLSVIVM